LIASVVVTLKTVQI